MNLEYIFFLMLLYSNKISKSKPLFSHYLPPIHKFELVVPQYGNVLLWNTLSNLTAQFPRTITVPVTLYSSQQILVNKLKDKFLAKILQIRSYRYSQLKKPKLTIVTNTNAFEKELIYSKIWGQIIIFIFNAQQIKSTVTFPNEFSISFRIPVILLKQEPLVSKTLVWTVHSVSDGELNTNRKTSSFSNTYAVVRTVWGKQNLDESCNLQTAKLSDCIQKVTFTVNALMKKHGENVFVRELCRFSMNQISMNLQMHPTNYKADQILHSMINYESNGRKFGSQKIYKNFMHTAMYLIFFPDMARFANARDTCEPGNSTLEYHLYATIFGENGNDKVWGTAPGSDKLVFVKYMTHLVSFNFLTCNSIEHTVNYVMFASYFDPHVWYSLAMCAIILFCVMYGYHRKSAEHAAESTILLIFLPPLLSVSVDPDKWTRQTFFMRFVIFIWILGAFLVNSYYQNIVISDFTIPIEAKSPWSGIYDLRNFTILSFLNKKSKYVGRVTNDVEYRFFQYKTATGGISRIVFEKGSLLYTASTKSFVGWFHTDFGSAMWSLFNPLCPFWSQFSERGIETERCEKNGRLIFNMEPYNVENIVDLYEKFSRCDQKNALIDSVDTIKAVESRVNVHGERKRFWSGDLNRLEIEEPIYWEFEEILAEDDIHLKRLKSLVESGLYAYLKSWTNPVNTTVLSQLEQKVYENSSVYGNTGVRPLSLKSNIVSIFFMYGACTLVITIFWVVLMISKLFTRWGVNLHMVRHFFGKYFEGWFKQGCKYFNFYLLKTQNGSKPMHVFKSWNKYR